MDIICEWIKNETIIMAELIISIKSIFNKESHKNFINKDIESI